MCRCSGTLRATNLGRCRRARSCRGQPANQREILRLCSQKILRCLRRLVWFAPSRRRLHRDHGHAFSFFFQVAGRGLHVRSCGMDNFCFSLLFYASCFMMRIDRPDRNYNIYVVLSAWTQGSWMVLRKIRWFLVLRSVTTIYTNIYCGFEFRIVRALRMKTVRKFR